MAAVFTDILYAPNPDLMLFSSGNKHMLVFEKSECVSLHCLNLHVYFCISGWSVMFRGNSWDIQTWYSCHEEASCYFYKASLKCWIWAAKPLLLFSSAKLLQGWKSKETLAANHAFMLPGEQRVTNGRGAADHTQGQQPGCHPGAAPLFGVEIWVVPSIEAVLEIQEKLCMQCFFADWVIILGGREVLCFCKRASELSCMGLSSPVLQHLSMECNTPSH